MSVFTEYMSLFVEVGCDWNLTRTAKHLRLENMHSYTPYLSLCGYVCCGYFLNVVHVCLVSLRESKQGQAVANRECLGEIKVREKKI